MADPRLAAVAVLLTWWASTGAILLLTRLPRAAARVSTIGVGGLALLGLYGLRVSGGLDTPGGAYLGFASALSIWAFHELTFLLGLVTGPRKEPCPADVRGLTRFAYGTAAVLYHELALFASLLIVAALTWRAQNLVGLWTFGVLWCMRLSAKLNVFLGVRNISTEFIPAPLKYLVSYFRHARLNPLMPLSIGGGSAVLVRLLLAPPDGSAAGAVGRALVATLLGLAVLEHLFLALPLPDAMLWRWALREES
jgi:putative photosynthetic complex assembly protein 2